MRLLNFSFTRSLVASLSVAAFVALPLVASAQQPYGDQPPPYGQQQPYSQPAPPYGNQQSIKGTLSGFDGQWIVYMHDEKGYTDHVTLHQGTIINPTGIKLLEGMRVTIYGYAEGSTFQANRIDVAYSPYSPYYGTNGEPAYGYGDGGYGYGGYGGGYGYGGYGYGGGYGYNPYGYGYGAYPYVGLGINWGWGWGWGWPGFWGWGWPYYGGYPGFCCNNPVIINHFPPPRGGRFPGGQGTIHGNPGGGGAPRGGMPGGGGGSIHAPVSGGGGGSMHAGGGGGRPPHR